MLALVVLKEAQECDKFNLDIPSKELFKRYDFCGTADSIQFHVTDLLMLQYVLDQGLKDLLFKLAPPHNNEVGNPIYISYENRRITQELLNTTLEVDFLKKHLSCFDSVQSVLEVGAGSGRTARGLLTLWPDLKYIVVDIPPALFISQETLAKQFPNKMIQRFSANTTQQALEHALRECDLIFLTPDQANLLPRQSVDLGIAIDCLHEMSTESIESYFDLFDRSVRHFYFKCWNLQKAKSSRRSYAKFDYPVKPAWRRVVHDDCHVPNHYFQALYELSAK